MSDHTALAARLLSAAPDATGPVYDTCGNWDVGYSENAGVVHFSAKLQADRRSLGSHEWDMLNELVTALGCTDSEAACLTPVILTQPWSRHHWTWSTRPGAGVSRAELDKLCRVGRALLGNVAHPDPAVAASMGDERSVRFQYAEGHSEDAVSQAMELYISHITACEKCQLNITGKTPSKPVPPPRAPRTPTMPADGGRRIHFQRISTGDGMATYTLRVPGVLPTTQWTGQGAVDRLGAFLSEFFVGDAARRGVRPDVLLGPAPYVAQFDTTNVSWDQAAHPQYDLYTVHTVVLPYVGPKTRIDKSAQAGRRQIKKWCNEFAKKLSSANQVPAEA